MMLINIDDNIIDTEKICAISTIETKHGSVYDHIIDYSFTINVGGEMLIKVVRHLNWQGEDYDFAFKAFQERRERIVAIWNKYNIPKY